ncbi:MAG: helix-turn-helix domain-containing protein, partial [Nitrospirales bacterium]
SPPAEAQLTPTEQRVYALLEEGPVHIDELIGQTQLPAPQVSSLLLALEIKGLVRQFPGPSYVRL